MEEYLQKVKDRLEEKKLGKFWIFPDKATFKPLSVTEKQMTDKIASNLTKYEGRKIANVRMYVDTTSKTIKENGPVISVAIGVFTITNNGELSPKGGGAITVHYHPSDLEIRKFTTKDLFQFTKLCADKVIRSDPIGGITLENLLKRLKKQKINLD